MWHILVMTLDQWMSDNDVKDGDLAVLVKVSRPFISRIRSGERQPSLPIAIRLSKATKLPVDAFVKRVS